jgi:hypothetical protein
MKDSICMNTKLIFATMLTVGTLLNIAAAEIPPVIATLPEAQRAGGRRVKQNRTAAAFAKAALNAALAKREAKVRQKKIQVEGPNEFEMITQDLTAVVELGVKADLLFFFNLAHGADGLRRTIHKQTLRSLDAAPVKEPQIEAQQPLKDGKRSRLANYHGSTYTHPKGGNRRGKRGPTHG